jgi:hypothetical protein
LIIDRRAIDTLFSPVVYEDVWWLAHEKLSTLLHTHVTSIRMLD